MTSTHKKPYEPLLIASRKGSGSSLQRQKVLCTVPMVEHSRKPNLQSKYLGIWKFVQCQSPHLGFLRRISPHFVWISNKNFSFLNVSHKSLNSITWNLIEYSHTQNFQREQRHVNVRTNTLLCNLNENSKRSIQTLFE